MQDAEMTEGLKMLREFIEKAREDEELADKLEEISKEDELDIAPALIRLGEEYGFRFTETDIGHYLDEKRQLMPHELDLVNGGCNSTGSGLGKIFGQWAKTKCFAAGSLISVPGGEKKICEIRAGDEVLSLDEDGKLRTGKVTDVMDAREMPVVRVLFDNGKEWLTTDTQWFYCGGGDYARVTEAGNKKAAAADGGYTGVIRTEAAGRTETVYDFVVDGLNVFFVNGVAAEGFSLS